ncbi:monovalent cation/H+ antiporter subunit D [Allostella vacuolata]|nr:monovalent cation/H+ antiporter subunit D [Stella vacuolata]
MMTALDHLIILPILLPLVAGAAMLLLDDRHRPVKAAINVAATLLLVVVAIALVVAADAGTPVATYPLGNWPVPFAIVLVADRVAALMVLLTAVLAAGALTYALARWHAAGPSFHSLFQLLLMGLNGAFLTGDLFNLFVFFEVLLAASYGLALHGSGSIRVRAGLHYIAVNLVASFFFLVGVSLIYGVAGTLNIADLAQRIPLIPAADRGLLEAGAAVLAVAFLIKAAMWPLGFWLLATYSAASAPVAAMFAIMTKVGAYIVLRLAPLLFGAAAGPSAGFGQSWLMVGGMATIAFGAIGVLAAQSAPRLAAYSVLVSSGTLLTAAAIGDAAVTAGALFYLVSSTLTIGAFFLLIELVERMRVAGADLIAVTREAYGEDEEALDEADFGSGVSFPAPLAAVGISFAVCGLLLAGLPPLSGFVAKFAMLSPLFLGTDGDPIGRASWWFLVLLILSGLSALVAMTRSGIDAFWVSREEGAVAIRMIEIAPVVALLALCMVMTVLAGPTMRYMESAAGALHAPGQYVASVLATAPVRRSGESTP